MAEVDAQARYTHTHIHDCSAREYIVFASVCIFCSQMKGVLKGWRRGTPEWRRGTLEWIMAYSNDYQHHH